MLSQILPVRAGCPAQKSQIFLKSQEISEETDGAFDITVAPLVNAWGFGFKHSDTLSSTLIDSLKEFVGYKKVAFFAWNYSE